MQDYESTFAAILASEETQPESFGALGDNIKNAIAKRIIEQALAMVKAGIDEPSEREAIATAAVTALRNFYPQTPAVVLDLLSMALTKALEAAASNLGG